MTQRTMVLTDTVYQYVLDFGFRDTPLLRRVREETAKNPLARMQIAPEQGALMHFLVQLMGVTNVLEIGVFTGYSSLCMASALPERGCLVALDKNSEWTNQAKIYWREGGVESKIDLRIGEALVLLDDLLIEKGECFFDLIFIDADKKEYFEYYHKSMELLRPGGLILIDNVLRHGRVADSSDCSDEVELMRRFNQYVKSDDRVGMVMLPIADGLTMAMKK